MEVARKVALLKIEYKKGETEEWINSLHKSRKENLIFCRFCQSGPGELDSAFKSKLSEQKDNFNEDRKGSTLLNLINKRFFFSPYIYSDVLKT